MLYPLEILVRDRYGKPPQGVVVSVFLPDDGVQRRRTDAAGVAHFEVPPSAILKIEVGGMVSMHHVRVVGDRIERIAVSERTARASGGHRATTVMIRCPLTLRAISTGVAVPSPAEFQYMAFTGNTVRCPECGGVHPWSKTDAFLDLGRAERPIPRPKK